MPAGRRPRTPPGERRCCPRRRALSKRVRTLVGEQRSPIASSSAAGSTRPVNPDLVGSRCARDRRPRSTGGPPDPDSGRHRLPRCGQDDHAAAGSRWFGPPERRTPVRARRDRPGRVGARRCGRLLRLSGLHRRQETATGRRHEQRPHRPAQRKCRPVRFDPARRHRGQTTDQTCSTADTTPDGTRAETVEAESGAGVRAGSGAGVSVGSGAGAAWDRKRARPENNSPVLASTRSPCPRSYPKGPTHLPARQPGEGRPGRFRYARAPLNPQAPGTPSRGTPAAGEAVVPRIEAKAASDPHHQEQTDLALIRAGATNPQAPDTGWGRG